MNPFPERKLKLTPAKIGVFLASEQSANLHSYAQSNGKPLMRVVFMMSWVNTGVPTFRVSVTAGTPLPLR